MKKILFVLLAACLFAIACHAQNIDKISHRCKAPNGNVYALILIEGEGDITQTPCPSKTNFFFGNVDFSNAVVTGIPAGAGDVLAGATHTTNFIPFWSNGGAHTISDTPSSWDGTQYLWNLTTAGNSAFRMFLRPSATGQGIFQVGRLVGASSPSIRIDDAGGSGSVSIVGDTGGIQLDTTNSGNIAIGDATSGAIQLGASNNRINMSAASSVKIGDANNTGSNVILTVDDTNRLISADTSTGTFTVGDLALVGNRNIFTINDTANVVSIDNLNGGATKINDTLEAGATFDVATKISTVGNLGGSAQVVVNGAAGTVSANNTTGSGAIFNSTSKDTTIGDLVGLADLMDINATTHTALFAGLDITSIGQTASALNITRSTDTLSTSLANWSLTGVSTFNLNRTITAGGTTGAQTINKPNGTVNIAAGQSSIVITNSLVVSTSTIIATANANDTTCAVKNAVPTANTITINMTAACTAETRVAFWEFN